MSAPGRGVRLGAAAFLVCAAAVIVSMASLAIGCDSIFGIGELPFPKDGGGDDAHPKPDAPDAEPVCTPTIPYTPIPWAPPTPRQAACTQSQLSSYETCFPNCDNFRKDGANAECVFCIETDVNASEHGPVITTAKNGEVTPVLVNVGGCQALADGMTGAGGCGDQENRARGCLSTECGSCSDYSDPAPDGPASTCESAADMNVCRPYATDPACDAELTSGVATDCTTLSMFLGTWCTVPDGGTVSCDSNMPFVPPPWQPPTPFGQNACTSDQIASFINECVDADNCATTFAGDPSNQACLQCIETDQSSGLYGPLVTNNGTIVLYNFGGCIDNTEDAGTCGQALNAFNACDEAECGKCPDFDAPSAMGQTAMCEANEFLMGNCTPYNNEGCFSEIEDAGAPAVCNEVSTLLTVWCGPPEVDGGLVDSGPPMDSSPPVDSGTPPVDSGTPPIDTGTPPIDSGSGPSDSGSEAGDGASGG